MTTFPGAPRLLRGSIVVIEPNSPVSSAIPFQYNPETLSRSISPRTKSVGKEKDAIAQLGSAETLLIVGPPKESISLKIIIDATDQLERGDAQAVKLGIHPQLAALEMLLYPKVKDVMTNKTLTEAGTLEIKPMQLPLTLFSWGNKRTLPVNIESLSIEEQAYDVNLNPIRAEVSLSMQVLSYTDLPLASKGGSQFMAYHRSKEQLATQNNGGINRMAGTKIPGLPSL
ncbi:MAG TPA: hypothetical protein V6C57_13135 [Coleofasciculaceae cyanobacterium]